MKNPITQEMIMDTLDWAYEKALTSLPGIDSAFEMAEDYQSQDGTLEDKVNSLIRWQNTKAGTTGFLTGLGGALTLPVTIPANIATVFYVQIRMIAAIAIMGGYNVKNDQVKSLVYAALTGNAANEVLKNTGIQLGTKLTTSLIKSISGETIKAINRAVGFRLITKFGQTGLVNLGKMLPILGGVIGGTFDAVSTNIIGNVARDAFIKGSPYIIDGEVIPESTPLE